MLFNFTSLENKTTDSMVPTNHSLRIRREQFSTHGIKISYICIFIIKSLINFIISDSHTLSRLKVFQDFR